MKIHIKLIQILMALAALSLTSIFSTSSFAQGGSSPVNSSLPNCAIARSNRISNGWNRKRRVGSNTERRKFMAVDA